MFHQKAKKKPPPRPPPPNFMKYKSKSSFNLANGVPNLIDWSPPSSPKTERSRFGGSVSSSYSSSTSSLTSCKKSPENDNINNWNVSPAASPLNWINNNKPKPSGTNGAKPRIIRPMPPKIIVSKSVFQSNSPPMPLGPPPSPPKCDDTVVTPYGIALFDFSPSQNGDLALQANDVVVLIRKINDEWLYGRIGDKEGMFPANFVQIEVPLSIGDNIVTALYEFTPQGPEDLRLRPGQQVKVLKKISNEWWYGESEGLSGQFPSNFVS